MEFRKLRADEIDCRVAQVKDTGVTLLLYKDARCDMNILDETVGSMNWTRSHCRDNANCVVSIWDKDKKQWISKEDTGTESNTEKEKGLASDSFKRACFNWGIGRELYTAPFVFIGADKCNIVTNGNKRACYDRFKVSEIGYDDSGKIDRLVIADKKGRTVYQYGEKKEEKNQKPDNGVPRVTKSHINTLRSIFTKKNIDEKKILDIYGVSKIEELNINQFTGIMNHPNEFQKRCGA
jgi:hypothetical protein